MAAKRGSIAFFSTYRPPLAVDIFSRPNACGQDEIHLTDGISYNYNCRVIPPHALKIILKRPKLACLRANEAHVDSGRLTGMVFVSERDSNLETLHFAFRFNDNPPTIKVFSFSEIYGTCRGVRMEDSGCFAGGYEAGGQTLINYLVYVSTMGPAEARRQPWTAVYKTNLWTGETKRLTPRGVSDLSPSVSPSGKWVAVASFQENGWQGEIEHLHTDIYVMPMWDHQRQRRRVIERGGWPTWGSDNIIFFHRKIEGFWGVLRADISNGETKVTHRLTPVGIDAMTPAAINDTKVAVATIRKKSTFGEDRVASQYRHIEIFDVTAPRQEPIRITRNSRPKNDHYNPFVIDGGRRIGYHRCKSARDKSETEMHKHFQNLKSPIQDVELNRVSGVFPTISPDGSKLAFVDNEFRTLWLADSNGMRRVFHTTGPDNIFSPVWNRNPEMDTLYVCMGPSFNADKPLQIHAISNVSGPSNVRNVRLTNGSFNNAFPSTDPQGKRLVFRSTRDGGIERHKNLYILENANKGEPAGGRIERLTKGAWTDTHCQWSPKGDWIVFSSTRDKPKGAPKTDRDLDPGYFAVYLVKATNRDVCVRVIKSGNNIAGHVNHPCFSPDGRSIAVSADLAAVSVDPISLPLFLHSVRPYGDIFTVDIDTCDIYKNKDVNKYTRITHSRYENSTHSWTKFPIKNTGAGWTIHVRDSNVPTCPLAYPGGGESQRMTGHLCLQKRCC